MPSLPLEVLPAETRLACERLRDGLDDALGSELVALWTYGAATFPDCPAGLGDVDTHGVLAHAPSGETSRKIKAIHDGIEADLGMEWDSWYILERDMASAKPPKHALLEHLVDDAEMSFCDPQAVGAGGAGAGAGCRARGRSSRDPRADPRGRERCR